MIMYNLSSYNNLSWAIVDVCYNNLLQTIVNYLTVLRIIVNYRNSRYFTVIHGKLF